MIDRRRVLAGMALAPLAAPFAANAAWALSLSEGASETPLRTVRVPGAGVDVPIVGIGTSRRYNDPQDDAAFATLKATVARFVELGGTVIDTAPSYGRAEEVIGQLVEGLGVRDRLFLATKVAGANAAEAQAQLAQSFRNLRTEMIDLVALHNPQDAAAKLAMLREMKADGRVRSIGASFSSRVGFADSIEEAGASSALYSGFEALMRAERLDTIQVDYAIDNRGAADRILPLAQEQGLAVMVNLPFGRGRLFEVTQGRPLPDWAAEIGAASWAQLFLKYIVSHPVRPIAIPGMAQPHYVADNLAAARGPMPDAAMRRRMEQYIDGL